MNSLRHSHFNPKREFFMKHCFKLYSPSPVYLTESGNKTHDLSLAHLDPFGKPVMVGFSETLSELVTDNSTPLCLDPSDQVARLRAIEARTIMNNYNLSPTIYEDSISAVNRANNIADKVYNNLKSLTQNTSDNGQ